MKVELAISLLTIALERGIPAVLSALKELQKEEITFNDIQALRQKIKKPVEYKTYS